MAKKTVKRIILTGAQGTGKTTLMNELSKDGTRTISHIRKTAAENGLDVLEEVCPLSARMVVNEVSMKMENERITKLIRDLKAVL